MHNQRSIIWIGAAGASHCTSYFFQTNFITYVCMCTYNLCIYLCCAKITINLVSGNVVWHGILRYNGRLKCALVSQDRVPPIHHNLKKIKKKSASLEYMYDKNSDCFLFMMAQLFVDAQCRLGYILIQFLILVLFQNFIYMLQ